MSRREGLSFQEAAQAALTEVDSAESDLAPTAVEFVEDSSEPLETEQPVVESEQGVFDPLFRNKQRQEGEQSFNENSLTFEVDGRQVTVDELKNGYLRQDDYTRKTQELSKLRGESENAIVLWEALQEKPQETIRALWQRVQNGQPAVEKPAEEVDIEALVAERVQAALAEHPAYRQTQEEEAMARVNGLIAEVEQRNNIKLNEADQMLLLERATELGTTDLNYAFYILQQEQKAFEQRVANASANSSSSAGRPSTEQEAIPSNRKYLSFREAMDDSLAEAGATRDTIFIA